MYSRRIYLYSIAGVLCGLAGIDEGHLLQAVSTAVEMAAEGDNGIPILDYTELVSTKIVKIIQSYNGL